MSERLAEYRRLFPVTERCVYMNHAAVGPLPLPALERINAVARSIAEYGDDGWPDRIKELERVRALAQRLLGAREATEIAYVANTSDGLSIVASGLDWREGDNVVGAMGEFPSNVYPWMSLARHGVEYRQAPERDGRIYTDELLALVDERTRAIAISWVEFATGFRFDLQRIGAFSRERGVLFVVDAIQGLGAIPIDVERDNIDVLASSAHKWLCGSEGIALLYTSNRIAGQLNPNRVGWTSTRDWLRWSNYEFVPRDGAGKHEIGTINTFGVHALGASLEILLDAGIDNIAAHCRALTDRLCEGLAAHGFRIVSSRAEGEWSPIVTVVHEHVDPESIVKRLHERSIHVASRSGRVRISPHFYNTFEEVDYLLNAL